jgi:hypothetical protein
MDVTTDVQWMQIGNASVLKDSWVYVSLWSAEMEDSRLQELRYAMMETQPLGMDVMQRVRKKLAGHARRCRIWPAHALKYLSAEMVDTMWLQEKRVMIITILQEMAAQQPALSNQLMNVRPQLS